MAYNDFRQDISTGERGEITVIKNLESMGLEFVSDNKDNRYDFIMRKDGRDIAYEVKTDVFCAPIMDSGNLFLEFECRGKESGIAVTQAEWFVTYFKFLKQIWYIRTKELRKLIAEENFPVMEFSGDPQSNTKGYLIKRKDYEQKFIIKKNIEYK